MILRRVAIITVVALYVVLVMGSLVTNTGSATGCGTSWPLCNGSVFPVPHFHTMVEFSHRIVTALTTVLVVWLAVLAWLHPGPRARNRWFAAMAVFFLFTEAGLGAAAVLWAEPPAVLATHFGVSLLAFGGVFLLALSVLAENGAARVGRQPSAPGNRDASPAGRGVLAPSADRAHARAAGRASTALTRFRRGAWALLLFTMVLIYLGAYVRHVGSFCATWPLCPGPLVPAYGSAIFPQFVHRLAASIFLLGLAWLVWAGAQLGPSGRDLRTGAVWALVFALAQALTGGLVVAEDMSVLSAMIHSSIIPLLFAAELYLVLRLAGLEAPGSRAATVAAGPTGEPLTASRRPS